MGQAFLLKTKKPGVNTSKATITARDISYNKIAYGAEGQVIGQSAFAYEDGVYMFADTSSPVMVGAEGVGSKTLKVFENELIFAEDHWSNYYRRLDYIQTSSSGGQYINSLYKPTSNNVEYETAWIETTLGSAVSLFGNQGASGATNRFSGTHYKPTTTAMYSATGATDALCRIDNITAGTLNTIKTTIKNGTITRIQNGVTSTASYSGTVVNNYDIYLFANNIQGTASQLMKNTRLPYWRMRDNGVLVRDYIPVQRISDNVVGLLDLVHNVFYGNAGTGSFTGAGDGYVSI